MSPVRNVTNHTRKDISLEVLVLTTSFYIELQSYRAREENGL